jgi:hypothetical protein
MLMALELWTFSLYGAKQLISRYEVSAALECVQELLAHGAVWNPTETTSLRRTLCNCEPGVTVALLQLFRKYNACPAERIHKLLNNPRIREHLAPESQQISRLGIQLEPSRSTKLAGHVPARKRA